MANLTPYQHSLIKSARLPITGRKAPNYKGSPLFSYYPQSLQVGPDTVCNLDFSTGIPKDIGDHAFAIVEDGVPVYSPNSKFHGLSLYVPVGSTSNLCYIAEDSQYLLDYPITLEAWIWLDEQGSAIQVIISAKESGNYQLSINASGKIQFEVYINDSYESVASTSTVFTEQWVYAAGSYDGTLLSVHNGLEQDTSVQTGHIQEATTELVFGAMPPLSSFTLPLRGYLGGAQILSRIKTQSEIEKYLIGV